MLFFSRKKKGNLTIFDNEVHDVLEIHVASEHKWGSSILILEKEKSPRSNSFVTNLASFFMTARCSGVLPFVSRVKDDFFSALASSQMKGKKKEKKKTLTICVSTSEGRQRERLLRLVNDGEVNYILFLHVHSHVSNLHAHHPIELVCFIGLDGRRNACLSSKRIHHPRHAGPKVAYSWDQAKGRTLEAQLWRC